MDPTIAPVPVGKIKIVRLLVFIYRCDSSEILTL